MPLISSHFAYIYQIYSELVQIPPHKVGVAGVGGVGQKVCISTIYARAKEPFANFGHDTRNYIAGILAQPLFCATFVSQGVYKIYFFL